MKYNTKKVKSANKNEVIAKVGICLLILWLIAFHTISYANLEDNEIVDLKSITNETVETAKQVDNKGIGWLKSIQQQFG